MSSKLLTTSELAGDLYDMIVIGAGPSGCSAAFNAAQKGLRVLLLDRSQFPRNKICGDGLSPRSVFLLNQMGVNEEDLLRAGAFEILETRKFLDDFLYERKDHPIGPGLSKRAFGLPRRQLDKLLLDRVLATGVSWMGGFHVHSVRVGKDNQYVSVTGVISSKTSTAKARLAVIASGTVARYYRMLDAFPPTNALGAARRQYFKLVDQPPASFDMFLEPYLPRGYAWIFPVGSHLVNVGVGQKLGEDKVNLCNAFELFTNENRVVRQLLKGAEPVSTPRGGLLYTQLRKELVKDGLLWVGDAAGLVNPISGEGIAQALESGQIAAEVACAALQSGDTTRHALLRYETEIRKRFDLKIT